MPNQFLLIIVLTTLFSWHYYSAHAADFCVADLTRDQTASGYTCKNPKNVTAHDFVFSGFVNPGNTSNPNRGAVLRAFVDQFPALNGMSLGAARIDMKPEGVVGLHTHPGSAEMVYVVEGNVTAGFISGLANNNTVYAKKLSKGEVMVIPQGLLHFQVNTGTVDAVLFVSFANADPGVQFVSRALFGNDFSSFLVEKTTGIGRDEVMRLKTLLGGSG